MLGTHGGLPGTCGVRSFSLDGMLFTFGSTSQRNTIQRRIAARRLIHNVCKHAQLLRLRDDAHPASVSQYLHPTHHDPRRTQPTEQKHTTGGLVELAEDEKPSARHKQQEYRKNHTSALQKEGL